VCFGDARGGKEKLGPVRSAGRVLRAEGEMEKKRRHQQKTGKKRSIGDDSEAERHEGGRGGKTPARMKKYKKKEKNRKTHRADRREKGEPLRSPEGTGKGTVR